MVQGSNVRGGRGLGSGSKKTRAGRCRAVSLAVLGVLAGGGESAHAVTTYTWASTGLSSTWSTPANWGSTTFPNAAGVIAEGPTASGSNGLATLGSNVTIGELKPGTASGGAGFQISGTAYTITMDGTGLGTNDFGNADAEIRDASSTGTFLVNTSLLMANTNLDIGWVNTLETGSMSIGTAGATTITSSTSGLVLNILSDTKGGGANPSTIINSAIGTSGSSMSIYDNSNGGGAVEFLGVIGSSVTTVTDANTVRMLLGNNADSFTGSLTINSGANVTLANAYQSYDNTQVIPVGATSSNLVDNGTLEMSGDSQQVDALTGNGLITNTKWDGSIGGSAVTLTIGNNNAAGTFGGTIVGTSGRTIALTKVGTGTQIFNNSGSALTGNITISAGTIQIGDGTNASATLGTNAFTDNANLAYDYNGAVTVTNVISGSGSVTQLGNSPLTLNAASTFSGGLNISSGSVLAGSPAGSLGSGTVTLSSGATLDLNGNNPTTGYLSSAAGNSIVTNNGGSNATLTITSSGSQSFAGVIQDGTTNTFGLTKAGVGTQTLTGVSTYSGATTVNAGTLALSSTAGLGNTAITVASGATFAPHAGSGTINLGSTSTGNGATLTLSPGTGSNVGAALSLVDGAIGVVDLNQPSSFSGTALTLGGGGSATNAPILAFDIGSSHTADELVVSTGSVSVGATGAELEVTPLAGITSLATGNYTLINAAGGGLNSGAFVLFANSIVLGTNSYSLSLANSTPTSEILTVAVNSTTPLNAYYTGNTSASWSTASNFATDHTGATTTAGIPGGGTNVYMTADTASNLSTTLDGAFNINSLSFTGTGTTAASTSVTVAAGSGGTLTLAATNAFGTYAAGTGIVVQAGSAAHTISAPVILGASQTWEIDNAAANPLTVSGVVSDGGLGYSLTKTGAGTLVLSAVNTYGDASGSTYVTRGTLVGGAVGAIPVGTSLVVNGGTFDLDGNSQSIANLSDGGVSTGSIIDTGGAVTLNTSSSITTTFSGSINAASASLVVNGTGTANLSGVNALSVLTLNAGTVNLSAANTIANVNVTVGTLTVASTGSIDASTGSVVVGDNGNLTVNGGSITAATLFTNSNGISTTLFTGGSTLTLSGALSIDNDNKSDQGLFQLSGGSITTSSITIGRTGYNSGGGTIVTAAPTNDGLYITSGSITDTGTLYLGTNAVSNSTAILRMDGGTLSVNGATIITDYGNTRASTIDVNGGTFTSPTVQIGGGVGAGLGEAGELLVRGTGVANIGTITFGSSAQTFGPDVLELLGGTLYVGAGGVVNGGGSLTPTFNLGGTTYSTAPILAASAPWSTSVGITLTNSSNGTAPIVQAANFSGGAENITLTGAIGGTGGLVKTGAGTLTLTAGNYYTGITTLNAGVLNINGQFALGGAVYSGTTFNGGTLQYAANLASLLGSNGTGDITQNSATPAVAKPVTLAAGGGTIDVNGNAISFASPFGNGGAGGLILTDTAGGGSLTLNSSSTYTGATTIAHSSLIAGAANVLAPLSAFNVSGGGTLNVSSAAQTVGSITVAATGTLDLSINSLFTSTGAATLAGTLNLSGYTAAASVELMGYSSYTGGFTTTNNVPAGYQLVYTPTQLDLTSITLNAANLTWNDAGGAPADGFTWDIATNQNWNNGTSASVYHEGDIVVFSDANNGTAATSSPTGTNPNAYNVVLNTFVHPTSVTVATNGAYSITGTGGIGDVTNGQTTLLLGGDGSLTLGGSNTYSGGTEVGTGSDTPKLILVGAHAYPVNSPLVIDTAATMQIAAHTGGVSNIVVATISSLTNLGQIDVTNNDLIIRGSSLASITTQIASGYSGGTWTGALGITSSTAAANTAHLTAVGVLLNDHSGTAIYSTFDGASTADGDVLVKFTYYGDANLDGAVDGSDYTLIDAGFHSGGALTGWQNGDFNYDGKIDGSDYTLIDNAFNTQGATLGSNPAAQIASSTAQLAAGSSAVPEPTTLGLLGVGAIGLLGRRRRKLNLGN